jgi:glutamine amidotransferase
MGNVKSVHNALNYLGHDVKISNNEDVIKESTHIILPGVGAFGDALNNLKKNNLIPILSKLVIDEKKPFLGICLGMQLLANTGEEYGIHEGLGWIDGDVKKFDIKKRDFPIPHVGWNDIKVEQEHIIFNKLSNFNTYYFSHSYHFICKNKENVLASCEYGIEFTSAIMKENIVGIQFHPEKSHENGLQLLDNFANWRPDRC